MLSSEVSMYLRYWHHLTVIMWMNQNSLSQWCSNILMSLFFKTINHVAVNSYMKLVLCYLTTLWICYCYESQCKYMIYNISKMWPQRYHDAWVENNCYAKHCQFEVRMCKVCEWLNAAQHGDKKKHWTKKSVSLKNIFPLSTWTFTILIMRTQKLFENTPSFFDFYAIHMDVS